jgi:hypothetical protein
MTTKKTNSTAKAESTTLRSAAKIIGVDRGTLENWRDEGCPGLPPEKFSKAAVLRWAAKNGKRAGEVGGDLKSRKTAEEIRKLRLANDQKEGRLVERAFVAERIQCAAGELNKFRAKSEAEHATRFAATNGDVAQCRTILRGIWDEIFKDFASLRNHFEQ